MDRLSLYLHDPDQPIVPGFPRSRGTDAVHRSFQEQPHTSQSCQSPSSPTFSNDSTVSKSTYSTRNSLSRVSTIGSGTSASTAPSQRAGPPSLNHHLATMPYNHGYDLLCEFAFVSCNERFDAGDFEHWIRHTETHFGGHPPPQYAICSICDDDAEGCFEARGDPYASWRDRMMHIRDHFRNGQTENDIRPDYWVIKYMKELGLIHDDDYTFTHKLSERPHCDKLVPLGFQTPEMKKRNENNERKERDKQQDIIVENSRRHRRKMGDPRK